MGLMMEWKYHYLQYLILEIKEIRQIFQMAESSPTYFFNNISQFKFLNQRPIGKGSFGSVKLALHIPTCKVYAIKIIDTTGITLQNGLLALKRQTVIHAQIDHPHIVRMWQVFEEGNTIYMVMEYIEGGNLFHYQNQHKTFREEKAAIFFGQTLSALEYLHSLDLMHRDLKPENLLLDKDLNIKICDFGWIAEGIHQKRTTFCGTYQYMAPEMIFDRQYDYRIDIWALGILLYQLLHGFAPFEGDTADQVRSSMLQGKLRLDPDLSSNVQNLICQILKVNPQQRISLQQVKKHPWMAQMTKVKLNALQKFENYQTKMIYQSSVLKKSRRQSIIKSNKMCQKKDNVKPIHLVMHSKSKKQFSSKNKNNYSSQTVNLTKTSKYNDKPDEKIRNKQNLIHQTANLMIGKKKRTMQGHKNSNLGKFTHKIQLSDFSEVKKKSRLKTETCETKSSTKKQIKKMKTESNELLYLCSHSPYSTCIKKKKTSGVPNLNDQQHYPILIRKSTE